MGGWARTNNVAPTSTAKPKARPNLRQRRNFIFSCDAEFVKRLRSHEIQGQVPRRAAQFRLTVSMSTPQPVLASGLIATQRRSTSFSLPCKVVFR